MRQILFHIPIINLPVYGYGLMLFMAYLLCTALARRLCKREGIDGTLIPDLAIWLFVAGILGGRAVFVIQYWHRFNSWYWESITDNALVKLISLWDGGLVLYGAIGGAAIGYFAYDYV